MELSTQESQLCDRLKELPRTHGFRYDTRASNALLYDLFWSLAGGQENYMKLLFPDGHRPKAGETPKLRKAQGAVNGAEYTEAARGKACGHIFKSGEATYRCKTCSLDDTCVLCSRCYDASDHTGHMVYISISPGNSGCCDCGDPEAWRVPVNCTIHTDHGSSARRAGKARAPPPLPDDFIESMRMTIGRALDYICDVISCSPENLRTPKTKDRIEKDERMSRLSSQYYDTDLIQEPIEYALLLWNDEKHTVNEVRDQVARACKLPMASALAKAHETDDIGRSIVKYDTDIDKLLSVARTVAQIKVTVTIRSARDTFREQMCGTIVEWLSDIAGCTVGQDHNILRQLVCEEMLSAWRTGSEANNAEVGVHGLDDHEYEERQHMSMQYRWMNQATMLRVARTAATANADNESDADPDNADDDDDDDMDGDLVDEEDEEDPFEVIEVPNDVLDIIMGNANDDEENDTDMGDDALEMQEATLAGYPPPPAPHQVVFNGGGIAVEAQGLHHLLRERDQTPSDTDTAEPLISPSVFANMKVDVPRTPGPTNADVVHDFHPPMYWLETPEAFQDRDDLPISEDLFRRVRLDWLITYDLRMWKRVRIDLRDLYISTVVTLPDFKRILGLRFAGLYTLLAQLYLIADREPDHSIINISLQMLTTPSITKEIVERGNFLTNLMAILYTFLTTRQVDYPFRISPNDILNFEAGSVTNRRMYHFFMDLRYLFGSEHVQERLRIDERYTMQFLDLVKLHQGICPNTRAMGDHVEYETDAWISASLVTREINRLCRQFADAFKDSGPDAAASVTRAIRLAAKAVIINSIGLERKRFHISEIKNEVTFKNVTDYEFADPNKVFKVVEFVVDQQPLSFHHALHYTLSWLIENAKTMTVEQLRATLSFSQADLLAKPRSMGTKNTLIGNLSSEDFLMAVFDYPLRVCPWLSQMKANMWVRNGLSLRHQATTYRGVSQRDVSHHRDIFLLQTAMVVCDPERVLASIVDRYRMEHWAKGIFEQRIDVMDVGQQVDIVEDMIHLLIILISDRTCLLSDRSETDLHMLSMRRDITHVLCFKPLSFTEICVRLPDKFQEQDECQDILDEMTTFRAPEGLSDVGTFELKENFMEDLDPYIAHYNKNQREESENAYKTWMAKKTGKSVDDVVFEPKLRKIESGAFTNLSAFTGTGMFAQIIYYSLLFSLAAIPHAGESSDLPVTRVESFVHVVLHLVLLAVVEDSSEEEILDRSGASSFVSIALESQCRSVFRREYSSSKTIASLLMLMGDKDEFRTCHTKIALILRRMKQKRPQAFASELTSFGALVDRIDTASPAINTLESDDRQKKKEQALARQKKVMASFQSQQQSFMDNQVDIDWGDEMIDDNEPEEAENYKKYWKYPSGTCILCQEETNETRPYGTFALLAESRILRQTNFRDADYVAEVNMSPVSLDKSADDIRPFGLAGMNREQVTKIDSNGREVHVERQTIGKGFSSDMCRVGVVSVGCGHIMHYKCFELYNEASNRRHVHQIARHHPERLDLMEFVCPLCKAQGNAFLPIIWKSKEETCASSLSRRDVNSWLRVDIVEALQKAMQNAGPDSSGSISDQRYQSMFAKYNAENIVSPIADKLETREFSLWSSPLMTDTNNGDNQSSTSISHPQQGLPPPRIPQASGLETSQALPWIAPWINRDPASTELNEIYLRLAKTMAANDLYTKYKYDANEQKRDDVYSADTMMSALGHSISAVEIQQRGVAATPGTIYIEKVSQQSLTHLRILADTARSYVTVSGSKFNGNNRIVREYASECDDQIRKLFVGHPQIGLSRRQEKAPSLAWKKDSPPLFEEDIFVFLTKTSLCIAPVLDIDFMQLMHVCYVAEIVKVIMLIRRNMDVKEWVDMIQQPADGTTQLSEFQRFAWVIHNADTEDAVSYPIPHIYQNDPAVSFKTVSECESMIYRYALVFLRKCVLLLWARYGIDFDSVRCRPDADELTRLSECLHLDDLNSIYRQNAEVSEDAHGTKIEDADAATETSAVVIASLSQLIRGWIRHVSQSNGVTSIAKPPVLSVSHPVIYELVGLPKNYDVLMEESMKRKCITTGKDVSDPMLCLFCGEIICGQSICCLKEAFIGTRGPVQIGSAQQHMRRCQRTIGLYLNIRKCNIFYLNRQSGTWMVAPYIDRYGEVDPGLRHGRQLFLNNKRYDALLRTVWLSHGIPSIISRKLEQDVNNGGWETI